MIKLKHRFFLLILFCCLPVAALQADPSKVALVIGNSNYLLKPNILPILPHPLNDAHDMADKLGALGFDVVLRYDIKKDEIDSMLNEFQSKLNPSTLALIFYAGHGWQIKGENYFPAVDADINSENDVPHQSLSVKQILYVLAKSKTQSNLIFLDACRDNPFNSEAGLARVIAPIGTLIFYSTRPGSVASDGGGRNGLYTNKLLKQMDSHQQIEQSLKIVAREVKAAYALQEPWQEGGILGNFCFAGCEVDTPVVPPQEPISAGLDSEAIELSFWDSIKSSTDPADFQAYLSKYPIGQFVILARNRLSQLTPFADVKPDPIIPSYVSQNTNAVEGQPTISKQVIKSTFPIAIVPFTLQGAPLNVSTIINADLERSGYFKMMDKHKMPNKPNTSAEVNFKEWMDFGQNYLVVGQVVNVGGGQYTVQFQLLDVYRGLQLLGFQMTSPAADLRRTAHYISDLIFEKLTGKKGVFTGRIANISRTKRGEYEIKVSDEDGYNPKTVVSSKEKLIHPVISPDGLKIAYESFENKSDSIYIQTLVTGERQKTAKFPNSDDLSSWVVVPNPELVSNKTPSIDTCTDCPEMVTVPGGSFFMGSSTAEKDNQVDEKPGHQVQIKRFSLGKYEVTRQQFSAFITETGYSASDYCYTLQNGQLGFQYGFNWQNPGFYQGGNHPAVCVNKNDIDAYIRWLNQKTGKRYRLPTEAEWEYAARASTQTARYWGDGDANACTYANVADQTAKAKWNFIATFSCADGYADTAPVGSFQSNAFGLYDMLGNVWEWTCSAYTEGGYNGVEYISTNDAKTPLAVRGGSWFNLPAYVRSASRVRSEPTYRYSDLGFRLAQDN